MANVLTSSYSVLPYGMLLTTIFRHFGLDLDGETDIRISKPYNAIDHSCIACLGYELHGHEWVEKATRVSTVVEEVVIDIPPTSPTDAPSPPPPTTSDGSSSTTPDWYQNLSQCLDTISLDIQ